MAKSKGKTKNKSTDPELTQSSLEADVRYGPQESQLRELMRQAGEERLTGIEAQQTGFRGIANLLAQARPQVKADAQAAASSLLDAAGRAQSSVAGLSSAADPFKAALARDLAGASSRMSAATTSAQRELGDRLMDAAAGRVAGLRQVQQDYAKTSQQLGTRLTDLLAEKGAFTSATYGELKADAAQRQAEADKAAADQAREDARLNAQLTQQERGSLYGAGINPDTGLPLPARAKPPSTTTTKSPWATKKDQGKFEDEVHRAVAAIQSRVKEGTSRHKVAALFLQGAPATKDRGAIPKFSQLPLSIALDSIYDKEISRYNLGQAHARGYKVTRLGIPVRKAGAKPAGLGSGWTHTLKPVG